MLNFSQFNYFCWKTNKSICNTFEFDVRYVLISFITIYSFLSFKTLGLLQYKETKPQNCIKYNKKTFDAKIKYKPNDNHLKTNCVWFDLFFSLPFRFWNHQFFFAISLHQIRYDDTEIDLIQIKKGDWYTMKCVWWRNRRQSSWWKIQLENNDKEWQRANGTDRQTSCHEKRISPHNLNRMRSMLISSQFKWNW